MLDRRIVERARCKMRAQICCNDRKYECFVRDLSMKGASLELLDDATLPDEFDVVFQWRGRNVAKKRWQVGRKVGVEFLPACVIDSYRLVKVLEEACAMRQENKSLLERMRSSSLERSRITG